MRRLAASLILLCGAAPLQDPAALIEQLRAEDIAVRERAIIELEKLGPAAEEALKKVVDDPDGHVAGTARLLLKSLALERTFSPALRKAFPGLAGRISRNPGEATAAYVAAHGRSAGGEKPQYSALTRADLEPLALGAVASASSPEDKLHACNAAEAWMHRSAQPAILPLLRDPNEDVREAARSALTRLRGRAAIPIFLSELADHPELLLAALQPQTEFFPFASLDRVTPLIRHANPWIRMMAVQFVIDVGAVEWLEEGLRFLKDTDPELRRTGLSLLGAFGNRRTGSAALALLTDAEPGVRSEALDTLSSLQVPIPKEVLIKLLGDPALIVRIRAVQSCHPEEDPALLAGLRRLLDDTSEEVRRLALQKLAGRRDEELIRKGAGLLERGKPGEVAIGMQILLGCAPTMNPTDKALDLVRSRLNYKEGDSSLRVKALHCLQLAKALPSSEALRALSLEEDPVLASFAARALIKSSPMLAKAEVPRWMADPGMIEQLHESIDEMISILKPEDPVSFLMKTFEASDAARDEIGYILDSMKAGAAAGPHLTRLLKSEDVRLKYAAIHVLERLKVTEARPELMALLKEGSDDVTHAVLRALQDIGPGESWEAVARLMESDDGRTREEAIRVLWRHPKAGMIPAFVKALDDSQQSVVEMAVVSLYDLDFKELPGLLVDRLQAPRYSTRSVAVEVLALLRPADARARILGMLEDRRGSERCRGIELMATAGLKSDARLLLPLLADSETGEVAARAFGGLEARDLIPELQSRLKSPDVVEREYALLALWQLGAVEAISQIRERASDADAGVRALAIRALGGLRDPDALPLIVGHLKDREATLQNAAVQALIQLGDKAAGPALIEAIDKVHPWTRHVILWALGKLRAEATVPALLGKMHDSDIGDSCVAALGEIGSASAVPELIAALRRDPQRWICAESLAKLGAKEALPLFQSMTREAMAGSDHLGWPQILAKVGDASLLEKNLGDESELTRHVAADAFCKLGDRRGVEELLKRADDYTIDLSVLNAVRNPAAWKAFDGRLFRIGGSGSRRRLIERLAGSAGLRVLLDPPTTFHEKAWTLEFVYGAPFFRPFPGPSAMAILLDLGDIRVCDDARKGDQRWEFILDSDSIRVLPRTKAIAFWKQWWANEQTKKK